MPLSVALWALVQLTLLPQGRSLITGSKHENSTAKAVTLQALDDPIQIPFTEAETTKAPESWKWNWKMGHITNSEKLGSIDAEEAERLERQYEKEQSKSMHHRVSFEDRHVSAAIASTLLGAITFVMLLFYALNHPDPDMKRYSYATVNNTIAIFCGILFEQGCDKLLNHFFLEDQPLWIHVIAEICQMMFWIIVLQCTLAACAGVMDHRFSMTASIDGGDDVDAIIAHHNLSFDERRESDMNMRCFGVLLGHVAAFASVNGWGTLQQAPMFRTSLGMEVVPVPIAAIGLLCIFKFTSWIRDYYAMLDDGVKDETEIQWDERTAKAENEIMGFTVSFMAIGAFRCFLSGRMPSSTGEEEHVEDFLDGDHSFDAAMLMGTALGLVIFTFFMIKWNDIDAITGDSGSLDTRVSRWTSCTITITSMGFAWCTYYGTQALLVTLIAFPTQVMVSLCEALILSFCCPIAIYILDFIMTADNEAGFIQIIEAITVLVGFAWEQCFADATHSISRYQHRTHPDQQHGELIEFAMICVCTLVIVPAWRIYLLPAGNDLHLQAIEEGRATPRASGWSGSAASALKSPNSKLSRSGQSTPAAKRATGLQRGRRRTSIGMMNSC